MFTHKLKYTLELPLSRPAVFAFFADAANLELITPPELNFAIITPLPLEMKAGTIIDYRLKLFGLPFSWRTGITAWNPPDLFIDEQLEGPYAKWVHRHTFREGSGGATVMIDEVSYRLPLSPFTEFAYPIVRAQLERIFTYRQKAVRTILLHG